MEAERSRKRRRYSPQLKAQIVAECAVVGASVAKVALSHGINANLLRRWVRDAEVQPTRALEHAVPTTPTFVPVRLPDAAAPTGEIRIEVRRASTTIMVAWPMAAATECATWIRELLR